MYKPRRRQNRDGIEREDGGVAGEEERRERYRERERESSEGGAEREKELSGLPEFRTDSMKTVNCRAK